MNEALAEAQAVGVDPDQIQACASVGDWDRLKAASAHHRRLKREAEEAAERAKPKEVLSESEAQQKLAQALKDMKELNATIDEYEEKMAEMAAELDAQQQQLSGEMAEDTGDSTE